MPLYRVSGVVKVYRDHSDNWRYDGLGDGPSEYWDKIKIPAGLIFEAADESAAYDMLDSFTSEIAEGWARDLRHVFVDEVVMIQGQIVPWNVE